MNTQNVWASIARLETANIQNVWASIARLEIANIQNVGASIARLETGICKNVGASIARPDPYPVTHKPILEYATRKVVPGCRTFQAIFNFANQNLYLTHY